MLIFQSVKWKSLFVIYIYGLLIIWTDGSDENDLLWKCSSSGGNLDEVALVAIANQLSGRYEYTEHRRFASVQFFTAYPSNFTLSHRWTTLLKLNKSRISVRDVKCLWTIFVFLPLLSLQLGERLMLPKQAAISNLLPLCKLILGVAEL